MADKSYQTLEQQIARIHRLLEAMDADVTWNDRIPDPDNPNKRGKSTFRYGAASV